MPASAHSDATRDACSSEPPASGSSRSRHARIAIRRSPAVAARSPSLSTTIGIGSTRSSLGPGARERAGAGDSVRLASGTPHAVQLLGRRNECRRESRTQGSDAWRYGCRPRSAPCPAIPGPRRYAAGLGSRTRSATAGTLEDAVKLTGERPMEGATPDSLLALHDAGYREVVARLGPGVVVDVGCGIGAETVRLDRARSARDRRRLQQRHRAARPQTYPHVRRRRRAGSTSSRATAPCSACATRSVDYAVSSHIIEHFVNPALHVIELARVLRADGTAFVITPNAPADFENPFHVYLVRARAPRVAARAVLRRRDVLRPRRRRGAQGRLRARGARAASGCCKLDAFNLRHRMPRRAYVWALRARAPAHLPRPRHDEHRHRLRHRRVALLPPRRRAAATRRCSSPSRAGRARRRVMPATHDEGLGHGPHAQRGREHRHARAAHPRRGRRRAHPRRRRRQRRRHRREGRGARRRARRDRGAAPARARWASAARTAPATRSASPAATTS